MVEDLLTQAKQLDAFIEDNGLKSPSFDYDYLADSPTQLPEHLRAARNAMANGANDLKKLALGPVVYGADLYFGVCFSPHLFTASVVHLCPFGE